MDVESPKYKNVDVIDFEVEFVTGKPYLATWLASDLDPLTEDALTFKITQPEGIVIIERRNVLWASRKKRVHRQYIGTVVAPADTESLAPSA